MTQSITVAAQLGPAYSASTISFKIYNIDGSQYANWTSTGFSQIGSTGTFLKANVSAPDAGGYIQFSADGGSTVLSAVADIPALGTLATAASIAALNNLSAQQVWEYVTRTLTASGDPTATQIADAVLSRGVDNVEDSASLASLAELLLAALESERSGTDWTIRKTTGGTFNTRELTLDAAADPVVGSD